MRNGMNGHSN